MNMAHSLDINAGLNGDRTRDQLTQVAGSAFRHWMRLSNDAATLAGDLAAARLAYDLANDAARRPHQDSPL